MILWVPDDDQNCLPKHVGAQTSKHCAVVGNTVCVCFVVIEMAPVVKEGSVGVGCSVVDGVSSWERKHTL
jgi:hypothetical protein